MSDHRIEHPPSEEAQARGRRFESVELENASYPFVDDQYDFHDGWSAIRRRRGQPSEVGPVRGQRRHHHTHH